MKRKNSTILLISIVIALGLGYNYWYQKYWEPTEIIKYSDGYQLKFEDFKGKVDNSSSLHAYGEYGLFFRWKCIDNEFTYKVYSVMNPHSSWMYEENKENSLFYQRIKFKAYELYARKLRRKLKELENPCALSDAELDELSYSQFQEVEQLCKVINYDIRASSKDEIKYKQWGNRLDSLLATYNDFSYEGNLE